MCAPPVILLTAAAAATTAVGQLSAGAARARSLQYAARVADQNTRLNNEAARSAMEAGQSQAQRLYRTIGQTTGQQNAAMAANGVDLSFGSAAQVQRDTAMLGAEDVNNLYGDTFQRARGFEINAANERARAKSSRMDAKASRIASYFDAAGTILGAGAKIAKPR